MKATLSTVFSLLLLVALLALATAPASAQFIITQAGPITANSTQAALAIDTASDVLYVCPGGPCQSIAQTLSVQTAQTALTNVTSAQTMFSVSLKQGVMNVVGRTLRVCGEAMFSNGATTPAITIGVKIGSSVTPVSATSASNANSNTNAPLNFCFNITTNATGASGTDEAHGWLTDATAAAWSAGTAVATYVDGNTAVSSTYDHTAANTLAVNISSTATLTSVTPRHLFVELIE